MEKVSDIVSDMIEAGEWDGVLSAEDRLYYYLTKYSDFEQRAIVIMKKFFKGFDEGISDAIRSIAFNSCDVEWKDSLNFLLEELMDHSAELYRTGTINNLTPCLKAIVSLYKEVDDQIEK